MITINQTSIQEIPPEIRRFNWGALLLNWIWSIRHGVWIGLWSLVPVLGLIMALVLGFKGNVWAWQKNNFHDSQAFLKAQRQWAWAGVILTTSLITVAVIFLTYLFNFSYPIRHAIDVANNNQRVLAYFGAPIKKTTWINKIEYEIKSDRSFAHAQVEVTGSKSKGIIEIEAVKFGQDWITSDLSIAPADKPDQKQEIIDLSIYATVGDVSQADLLPVLDEIVEVHGNEDYLKVTRSKELGDYMLAYLEEPNHPEPCFLIQYKIGGETKEQNQMYVSKECYLDTSLVADIFNSYMTGKDDFIGLIAWEIYN